MLILSPDIKDFLALFFFNTGTDEHGLKIYRKAVEGGQEPQKYADEYFEKFKEVIGILGLFDGVNLIRTTDENHKKSAQEFWKVCDKNGYIYKKNYKIKYCVGCELEDRIGIGRWLLSPPSKSKA